MLYIENIRSCIQNSAVLENDQISGSYLIHQVQSIYAIKKYIHILSLLEKMLSFIGLADVGSIQKREEYKKLQQKLENNFQNNLREIASHMILDESFSFYLERGFTKRQLQQIQLWDALESQNRWRWEHGREVPSCDQKKLEKSIHNVYHSFL